MSLVEDLKEFIEALTHSDPEQDEYKQALNKLLADDE